MNKWAPILAATALAAASSSAATLVYELKLVTDSPYSAFGGGAAGDTFIGTFGFDDSLLGSTIPVFEPILSENAFFLSIDINGTLFSTDTPGTILDNGLRFMGGPLLDVFFDVTNPNGARLEVRTDFTDTTLWIATDGSGSGSAGGNTFEESADFEIIPEPSLAALVGLGALLSLTRRRHRQPDL